MIPNASTEPNLIRTTTPPFSNRMTTPSSQPSSSNCGLCNCVEFKKHAFKPDVCGDCYHKHG